MAVIPPIHPKVAAGSTAGAVTVLVVFIAESFGLTIPPEVASAFTLVVSAAAGFIKSEDGNKGG